MDYLYSLLIDPHAWIALAALVTMEVVLGIDNLIFISILSNKLPPEQQKIARRIGLLAALGLRIVLLGALTFIIHLVEPLFSIMGKSFSGRDLILISGGLFLVWKATREIHHVLDPEEDSNLFSSATRSGLSTTIVQILFLDFVFSIDSIITAVGMTEHLPIMIIAVIAAVLSMILAADTLSKFIKNNPTIVMLVLGFLLMIGMTLLAEGFGANVPKGYIYSAMAFAAGVEGLNILSRRSARKQRG
ncbi:MAG: TerC family protein [Alphaproteobacteria bacterium]|nr:TerC family protein [Alphaproteobacteria bacterium]